MTVKVCNASMEDSVRTWTAASGVNVPMVLAGHGANKVRFYDLATEIQFKFYGSSNPNFTTTEKKCAEHTLFLSLSRITGLAFIVFASLTSKNFGDW